MSVIRFWYSEYSLKPHAKKTPSSSDKERHGALLKIQWPDGYVGYGDLFPLLEYGDREVKEQLYDLAKGKISDLLEQTIWLARRDAVARKENRNLLRGLPRVKNHFLIQNVREFDENSLGEIKRLGYDSIKLKCGNDLKRELALIDKMTRQMGFKLRLDFGAKLSIGDFKSFVDGIVEPLREKIEFVEDPVPFEPKAWTEANKLLPVAADFEWKKIKFDKLPNPLPFKVVIIKPARQIAPAGSTFLILHHQVSHENYLSQ